MHEKKTPFIKSALDRQGNFEIPTLVGAVGINNEI